MKASELIKALETAIDIVGDVEITMDGGATIHELHINGALTDLR